MAVNNSGIYENLMLFGFLLKEPNNCWLETKKSMNANIATSVKPCVRGGLSFSTVKQLFRGSRLPAGGRGAN